MTLRMTMLRFGLAGVVNTAVNYGTFSLLVAARVRYLEAAVLGFLSGVVTSYLINRRWTFACRTAPFGGEASRFLLVNLVTLGVYTGVTALCGEGLHSPPRLAWLVAMAVSFPVNFFGSQRWAFRSEARSA